MSAVSLFRTVCRARQGGTEQAGQRAVRGIDDETGGVEDQPQDQHLLPDRAKRRIGELRQEGEDEERHLGVEDVGQKAVFDGLQKPAGPRGMGAGRSGGPGLPGEPEQIGRPGIADNIMGMGQGGNGRRKPPAPPARDESDRPA